MRIQRGRPPKLRFEGVEAEMLSSMLAELRGLLGTGAGAPAPTEGESDPLAELLGPQDTGEPADDPVTARLLPDAYTDDEDAASDWRRLGRSEVRAAKLAAIAAVEADLASNVIPLSEDRLTPWLATLTDLRLAIGTQLEIEEDWVESAVRLPEDDPRRAAYTVYSWLSELQESILATVS